jgi:hypothetical protein
MYRSVVASKGTEKGVKEEDLNRIRIEDQEIIYE